MRNANEYRSALKPVWCPGCGDFGVLKALTQALGDLDVPPEKVGMISGIGCSSRMPGYMRAFSFNSIHGRALPIASGLKLARPDLTVVAVGGDGDGLSIGAGHLPHAIRRDVDITYIMMDNGIYALTKGQASATTEMERKAELGLAGTQERPINPVMFALSLGCGFVANAHSGSLPLMRQLIREAIQYPGFAFVRVLAGCATYQSKAYQQEILARCDQLPEDHDPTNIRAAVDLALTLRFQLGVLYRRPPEEKPAFAEPYAWEEAARAARLAESRDLSYPVDTD
ncbi:MAG TPA: thiamine pyrophosphate-dependent enzyme [Terriglobales bacterium]|nr:thiamine pyrophosphate-dependent enzyme [Terriglobales bacterium]